MSSVRSGRCHAVAANLATEEGVQQLATRLGEQMTHLDILVNNAGTTWGRHWKATRSKAGKRSCN